MSKQKPLEETITVDLNQNGKGDRNRSTSKKYTEGYKLIDWKKKREQQGAFFIVGSTTFSNLGR